jgi:hypothetical protein
MGISFVAGSMLNSNLTRDSNLAFNTNTLYINYSGNSVGIGTVTPGAKLEVVGNILAGNVTIANIGTVSAAGNVTGGNVLTSGIFSATGNVYGGNLLLSGDSISTTDGNLVTFTGTAAITIPNGSTAQRPGYPSYATTPVGAFRLNTGLNQIEAWTGSSWITGSGATGNTTIVDQQITPDGINATYTLTEIASQSSVLVSINGTGQLPGVAYTVAGNSITFTETPLTSDIIDVRFLAAALSHDMIYNSDGSAAVVVQDNANIIFTSQVVDMTATQSLQLPGYTVAQAANIATPATGQVIYVSNGDGGNPCLAVYSSGTWKRVSLGATIST